MIPALVLGLLLWLGYGIGRGPGNGWMHAKLLLVLGAVGYHHFCGALLRQFEVRQPAQRALVPRLQRSHRAAVRCHRRAGGGQAVLSMKRGLA